MRLRLAVFIAAMLIAGIVGAKERRIAITFDDAPRPAGRLLTAAERTDLLLRSLANAGVDEAMFFVTTRNLDNAGDAGGARLRQYTDAGHTLANHSHEHRSANRVSADVFN